MLISRKILNTYLHFWISEETVKQWFRNKNVFFVLSMGRSGTKFLSSLLGGYQAAYVVHEPLIDDFKAHQQAFHSEKDAQDYIKQIRLKEIYLRSRKRNIRAYGEVNSVLRRHSRAIKNELPHAKLIHLIRDGRNVVRSMMSRWTMTNEDPNTRIIFPTSDDPWKQKWPEMSRFQKLCWYWWVENDYLSRNIDHHVKFENLISDYDYFKTQLLDKIHLNIPKHKWEEEVNKPKNITKKQSVPHWKEWDSNMTDQFNEICGDLMKKFGYL